MQPAPPNRDGSPIEAWSLNELTHHLTEGVWLNRRLNLQKPLALVMKDQELDLRHCHLRDCQT